MWETIGRAIKRVGKATGNQRMIDQGRHLQYGHLSPEQLMKQHPSAFLRTYAIQSHVEHPEHVGRAASTSESFQLRTDPGNASAFPNLNEIVESSTGRRRTPTQHLHLVLDEQAQQHEQIHTSTQVGGSFRAALLPMRQARSDDLGGEPTEANVEHLQSGRISDAALGQAHEDVTLTTQLSGCTIAKRRDSMLHLRPHESGKTMHESLPPARTFGRLDYPEPHQQAFVMMRQKPDGHTRIYFQVHDAETNTIRSGKKDFPAI